MSIATQIERINTAKANIKEVVNQDFEKIQDETLTYYPEKIAEVIEEYKKYIPEKTVSGTEINISDAAPLAGKLAVKGNTEQKSLTGKNLLDYTNIYEGAQQGIKTTLANNELSFKGTTTAAYANILQSIAKELEAKTYTLSINQAVDYDVRLRIYYDGGTYTNHSIPKGSTSVTFTTTSVGIKHYIYLANFSAGLAIDDTITIKLEEGSTATDFEEYCGGQASPNPDYPQEIKVVTGNNIIKHVGKNKLDRTKLVDGYVTNNGEIYVDKSSNNREEMYSEFIRVKPNTKYIFSIFKTLSNYENWIGVGQYEEKSYSSFVTRNTSNQSYIVFTTSSTTEYVVISARNLKQATEIQFEEGSTATEYEEYREEDLPLSLGNIELCKIGDYEDVLFKNVVGDENYNAELESGAWYKKNSVIKTLLDGNETWTMSTVSENVLTQRFRTSKNAGIIQVVDAIYSDKFVGKTSNISPYDDIELAQVGGSPSQYIYIHINKNRLSEITTNAFKDWLSNNNLTIYTVLMTPTYTKITDPTLISQLEALRKAKWFKGVNHWWTETENLEPVLEGTYKQALSGSEVS